MKIKSKRHADNNVEPKEDRKIFHVDVGHIAKDDIKRYLEKINEQIKESMGMRMTHANPKMYLGDDMPVAAPSVKHIEMPVSYFKELEPIKASDFLPMPPPISAVELQETVDAMQRGIIDNYTPLTNFIVD